MNKKRALISVSDKTGLVEFAQELVTLGFELISTGGTKATLQAAGLTIKSVEAITHFPEIMDGRVKTLHPAIHGGLLGIRGNSSHQQAMEQHQIEPIDLVCVNLYPFKDTLLQAEVSEAEVIDMIDIGGPSMLRSAAKNFKDVTAVIDSADYPLILKELEEDGTTTLATRKKLAAKVFRHTAAYDALIADYLTKAVNEQQPETYTLTYELKQSLRYGENSHQAAAFYQAAIPSSFALTNAKQLHGRELSYNNIKDADAAIKIAAEFEQPTVVAVKHMNPCGIGSGATIAAAYECAYTADPISIFGGIIVLNREVDQVTARKMSHLFLEMIIAPSFSADAFTILANKKNLRLVTLDFTAQKAPRPKEIVSVLGGLLVQDPDLQMVNSKEWQVVTKRQPTEIEFQALAFAWKAVKHVKSNGIVIANNHQTLGIGAGQMNRIGSVKIAIAQAQGKLTGAALASDAFFPMDDSVQYAAEHGVTAIIQPGGSLKDRDSIEMADKYDVAMIFTGQRHFKH
ncbi:bifunctional phosphoribosylaminoimidazolecarboxamide formyltransferase/IMP cyclohydrolase [Enterococcus faecalis]